MFRIVEEKVGESGTNIFFIDDSHENCEFAKHFGWQVFEFDSVTDGGIASCAAISKILLS